MKSSLYLLELDDLSWNVYHDSPQHLQHFIGAIQSVISNRWNRVRLPLWSILLVNKQGFVMTNSRKYIHKHSYVWSSGEISYINILGEIFHT